MLAEGSIVRLFVAILVSVVLCVVCATTAAPAPAHARPLTAQLAAIAERGGIESQRSLAAPGAVRTVSTWWTNLGTRERGLLEAEAPRLVGNLDGVPFSVRAQINAKRLRAAIKAAEAQADRAIGVPAIAALTTLATLRSVTAALRHPAGEPKRSLITFDMSGSTLAAIAIGDLDTATDVSFLIPGMMYTVRGQLVAWTSVANRLYQAQRETLQRLGEHDRSVATVAWLGYQTPDLFGALSLARAKQGAVQLREALSGLLAVRSADPPFLSVIAHSYGSTVALLALQSRSVAVDALALLGSPGGDVADAGALDVHDGNVYVGAAALDPVAVCGCFGTSPDSTAFGAHRMSLGGGIDPLDGATLLPTIGHNGYFDAGTESMRDLALIGTGHGALTRG